MAVLEEFDYDVPGVCSFYLGLCLVLVLIDLGILDPQLITILGDNHEPFLARLTLLVKNNIYFRCYVSGFGEELN